MKKINYNYILYFILALIFLFVFYYFPFNIEKYSGINNFRDYYSIVTGVSAIILGLFYYFHKITVDKNFKNKELQRQRLSLLLNEINNFDNLVDQILNKQFKNDSELSFLRNKVSRSFEIIEILVKQNKNNLNLKQTDISIILEVNSFVDKSETIMRITYKDIVSMPLYETKDIYIEKIKDIKRICFERAS